MSLYLVLNIFIITFPLLLSFESKIRFYKNISYYLFSILIVSSAYIVWDSIAEANGTWGFNENYLIGFKIFNLPIEEVLFFITVPYSTIFIYECCKFYIKEKHASIPRYIFISLAIILSLLSIILWEKNYTSTVLMFTSSLILAGSFTKLFYKNYFWLSLALTYIPFLIVNYILTSLPVVTYNDAENLGIRFITIPLDDFLYSFSMIGWWIFFYEAGRKQLFR